MSEKSERKIDALVLSKNQLVELEAAIREYLLQQGNKARMVDVINHLTTEKIKWQHIIQAIHNSVDIKEDGRTVRLVNSNMH